MFYTEKILNVLEINENLPAIILDENDKIVSYNKNWKNLFPDSRNRLAFHELFSSEVGISLRYSLIDVRTLDRRIKKEITLKKENRNLELSIFITPFKISDKKYSFAIAYEKKYTNDFIAYPAIISSSTLTKSKELIEKTKMFNNKNLIKKNRLQSIVNDFYHPFAIKHKNYTIIANKSFNNIVEKRTSLIKTLEQVLCEIFKINSPFIFEKLANLENDTSKINEEAFVLFPVKNDLKDLDNILIFNKKLLNENINEQKFEQSMLAEKSEQEKFNSDEIKLSSTNAQIAYDSSSLDIIKANEAAAELYGYHLADLKTMNVTQLFDVEDLQSLLYNSKNSEALIKQQKKDGTTFEVRIEQEIVKFGSKSLVIETIFTNEQEEEIIELEEYESEENFTDHEEVKNEKQEEKEIKMITPIRQNSDFLSTLFHEILTPTNVILGFIQEIIDSIDNPSEEQSESAKIIKDNQQRLLHAMNMAIQYAQLEEDRADFIMEKFDLSKYMLDIKDSLSKFCDENNVSVLIKNPNESLIVKHDRSRFLASISYLIRFVVQLTNSNNVYVKFRITDKVFDMFIKNSESRISKNIAIHIMQIYGENFSVKNMNFGISPISIILSRKINETLSAQIKVVEDEEGNQLIKYSVPCEFKENIKTVKTEIETPEEEEIESNLLDQINGNNGNGKEHEEKHLNSFNENIEEIIQQEIDEDQEIETEEIATNEQPDFSQSSCLLIDDSTDAGLLFKTQMKDFEKVEVRANLRNALPLLHKYKFDYIFVDINLNDIYNGIDALKIIKQFDDYKNTPIFAVTAYPFKDDKDKFLNLGFTNYFVKPFIREQFDDVVQSIVV